MLGEAKALETLKKLVSTVEADQAEAFLTGVSSGLTRFANSTIHQNVFERDSVIYLRVAVGKKIGIASSNVTDADALKDLAKRAVEIARSQVDNPDFEGFAKAPRAKKVEAFYADTADCERHAPRGERQGGDRRGRQAELPRRGVSLHLRQGTGLRQLARDRAVPRGHRRSL